MRKALVFRCIVAAFFVLVPILVLAPAGARADSGFCGVPFTEGPEPKASDCLFTLRSGVGLVGCRLCICDTSGNGSISATDALLCLRRAVGQVVSFDCPPCGETTTTSLVVTTTMETTTTTMALPGGDCPGIVEWETDAGYGKACTADNQCDSGACDDLRGRCRSASALDLGWTGLAHDVDLNDQARLRVSVDCPGTGGACGSCTVTGLDPSGGACRCANDLRRSCDEPQQVDGDDCPACEGGAFFGRTCATNAECDAGACTRRCDNDSTKVCTKKADCGDGDCPQSTRCDNGLACTFESQCRGTCTTGALCQCFDGAPLPLVAGGVPLCMVNRYDADVTGTVNVDSGAGSVSRVMRAVVFNGQSLGAPCPYCGGTCSNAPASACAFDSDCPGGLCNLDPVPRDGLRGGTCVGGPSVGQPCDVHATNASFPVSASGQRGGGTSLDCMPGSGTSVSGAGLKLAFVESTTTAMRTPSLPCSPATPGNDCACRVCSGDTTVACASDADCAVAGGTCSAIGGAGVEPQPNTCTGGACTVSGGEGSCTTGPDDLYCDALLQSDGRGIVTCANNADCAGVGAGQCTLLRRRDCFGATLVAAAFADPLRPRTSSLMCLPPLSTAGRNATIGLPGPARLVRDNVLRSFCAFDPGERYSPGVGGCHP